MLFLTEYLQLKNTEVNTSVVNNTGTVKRRDNAI